LKIFLISKDILSICFLFILAFRKWGNRIPLAKKLVIISSFIWLVILCHRLIWYGGASNGRCEAQPGVYAYFDNLFGAIVTCIFPIVTLSILGTLIGRSVRHVVQRRKVVPTTTTATTTTTTTTTTENNQSLIKKMDTQLTIMLFLDIFVAMISFLPYAAQLIYINVTQTWSKSPLRVAWENIITEIINLLSYIFFSTSFYVSIISLTGFRNQLLRTIGLKN
jgi:hypothetical protein